LDVLGVSAVVGGAMKAKAMSKARQSAQEKAAMLDDPDVPLTPDLQKQHDDALRARRAIMKYKLQRLAIKDQIKREIAFDLDIEPWQVKEEWAEGPMQARMSRLIERGDTYHKGVDAIGKQVDDMFVKESLKDTKLRKDVKPLAREQLKMKKPIYQSIYDIRDDMLNRVFLQELLHPEAGADTYFMQRKTGKKGSPVTIAQEFLENPDVNAPKKSYKRFEEIQDLRMKMRQLGVEPQDIHRWNMGRDLEGKLKVRDVGHAFANKLREIVGTKKGKDLSKKVKEAKNVLSKTNKRLFAKEAKRAAKRLPAVGLFLTGLGLSEPAESASLPVTPRGGAIAVDDAIMGLAHQVFGPGEIGGGELPPEEIMKREIRNAKIRSKRGRREEK
jgi:hypothetical protein